MTAEEFKQRRAKAGLSQRQLGLILHRSARMIKYYESGYKIPALVVEKMRGL